MYYKYCMIFFCYCFLGTLLTACSQNQSTHLEGSIEIVANEYPYKNVELEKTPLEDKRYKKIFKVKGEEGLTHVVLYHRDGKIKGKGFYKNGKKEGSWKYWFDNQRVRSSLFYKNGEEEGIQETWHENGQKRSRKQYLDGRAHGEWEAWYSNSQKKESLSFNDGLRTGKYVKWHANGQVHTDGQYDYGDQHGTWKQYDETGTMTGESHYEYGAPK